MDVKKRDDQDFEFTFLDKDGEAIDLTDYIATFIVKKEINDLDNQAYIEKEITEFPFGDQGILSLSLTREDTEIPVGDYYFEIQLRTTDDKIISTEIGRFLVSPDLKIGIDSGS